MENTHDAWIEIDLSAIKHNVRQVVSRIGNGVRLMAVVKADAYGHGAVETSKAMIEAGANALAVTRLEEAERLRQGGITAPILVFDSIQPSAAVKAVELGVDVTVCTPELVTALGTAAQAVHKVVNVHLKIDTGMGRLGILNNDVVALGRHIASTEGISWAGTYTHFATSSEKDLTLAKQQLEVFNEALLTIRQAFLDAGTIHAANSAAILRMPDAHFDMVRPGTILYGQYPSGNVPRLLDLKDTWKLKARVSFVKNVPAKCHIGYGAEFTAKRKCRIAVIPLGWSDGLTLTPESIARRGILRLGVARMLRRPPLIVSIKGKKAPVVGRIAMQMCSVDVSHIPDVEVGDEAVINARRVTTSPLLPRIYSEGSENQSDE
jgi:alanine racemase